MPFARASLTVYISQSYSFSEMSLLVVFLAWIWNSDAQYAGETSLSVEKLFPSVKTKDSQILSLEI